MMERCAGKIACWLIRCQVIEESDRELYEYAASSFFMSFMPFVLGVILGVVLGGAKESFLIILPFAVIRKFSGGYHAKHAGSCLLISGLLVFLCIELSFYASCSFGLIFATVLAALSLGIFSPIDNENRRLDAEEKRQYKAVAIKLVAAFLLTGIILSVFCLQTEAVCLFIGIILTACLQLPCIVKKAGKLLQK